MTGGVQCNVKSSHKCAVCSDTDHTEARPSGVLTAAGTPVIYFQALLTQLSSLFLILPVVDLSSDSDTDSAVRNALASYLRAMQANRQ